MAMQAKYLTTKEAADRVRLSESALEKKRVNGTGPIFVKLGRAVRYEIAALDEWVAAGRHKSTAAPLNSALAPDSASAAGLQAA
jgi:predicted DNA-binding transcriptional regulator AlpA